MHARLGRNEANVITDSNGEFWHKRLSHMSERGVHMLAEKHLLLEVKGMHLNQCVDCMVGKQNRAAFHSNL